MQVQWTLVAVSLVTALAAGVAFAAEDLYVGPGEQYESPVMEVKPGPALVVGWK